MLGGYQLAGAPLAGSGLVSQNWTKLLTESVVDTDTIVVTKLNFFAITLREGIYDYDTYIVYNPNTHQQRDNVTVNPKIKMKAVRTDTLRIGTPSLTDGTVKLKAEVLHINLKR